MKKRVFATAATVLISVAALLVLLCVLGRTGHSVPWSARAAPLNPMVTGVDPSSAPNDLDTPIVVTGTGFSAGLSGTLVITQPMAYLGDTALEDVSWVSTTTLEATVPGGMSRGAPELVR